MIADKIYEAAWGVFSDCIRAGADQQSALRAAPKVVIWVACYAVEIDEEIGIPVRDLQPARHALEKRQIRLITKDEAERINALVSSRNEGGKKFIEQRLAERWRWLKEQGYGE